MSPSIHSESGTTKHPGSTWRSYNRLPHQPRFPISPCTVFSPFDIICLFICFFNTGCDINSRNNFGFTPLHWAATREKWLVHHLLKRGADPSILTFFSRAPAAAFTPGISNFLVSTLLVETTKLQQSF